MSKYHYKVGIQKITQQRLVEMARDLDFFVTAPSRFLGNPSPADLLDKLAAAYQADPTAVTECLRQAGVIGDGPPPPTPANLIAG